MKINIKRLILCIAFAIYEYFRYQKNLLIKKDINRSLFNTLKKSLEKKLIVSKKKYKGNLLIASFVHQLGYTYSECVIANHLAEIKNLNIIGLMDDNDEQTKAFFKCFNSKKNIFFTKQKITEKIQYILIANKILTKYKNVDEFLKFKPNGIQIGETVYDHFIRNDNNPSTNYLSYKFLFFLAEALYVNDFSKKFFKKNKINYMVMSEKQYIPSIIIFQNALKAKIKVITRVLGPKEFGIAIYKSLNDIHWVHKKLDKKFVQKFFLKKKLKYADMGFNRVKNIFNQKMSHPDPNIKNKIKKIKNVKNEINQFYKDLNLDPAKKTCFVFSHNLLDGNLNGKKIHIFKDYLSWLRETLGFINKLDNNINWIIKEHPSDYGFLKIKTTAKIEFDKIIGSNNKNIRFYPKNYNKSIIKDIADCVVSLSGSCGTEYTCFGIPSINSGGIFYSENGYTNDYRNKKEYFSFLQNIDKIIEKKLTKNQIYKARVHYYLSNILTRYANPLLYNFDITRNLDEKKFFNTIIKLIYKYSKKEDKFKEYLTYQLNNGNRHLINNHRL
jgi:hypothetical protein